MSQMRILHVASPSAFGGLERVVTTLARTQLQQGDDVHVATLSDAPAAKDFLAHLGLWNITTHLGTAGERDYWGQRNELRRLQRLVAPDVVHTHGYRADVLAAALRSHATRVTTLHGFTGGDFKLRCYEWLQRRVVRSCDGVVAVSEAMARELARGGFHRDRLHIIPNILPPPGPRLTRRAARQVLQLPPEGWIIGWVGRLSREKGLDLLLEALAIHADPRIRLAVIGDGVERAALEAQARALGLEDRVDWRGAVTGADRLLAAFDVMVLSSRTEGSPIVLLEAIDAGIPVVAAAVGGVPEAVTPATAVLVPAEDPRALAAGIREVQNDPGGAARRSVRAHVRAARNSDPARWVARYAEVYDRAVHARQVAM
jgi:glycosyltransferase involved in cell wall biosynthesis